LKPELADGAAVSEARACVGDHATVVVDEDVLVSVFFAFAALGAWFIFATDAV
jgi:hypothetical protein